MLFRLPVKAAASAVDVGSQLHYVLASSKLPNDVAVSLLIVCRALAKLTRGHSGRSAAVPLRLAPS
jgi:hypothetical protein